MSKTIEKRYARALLKVAAALVILPVVALPAPALGADQARPVPAAYDTLARFLPADAVVLEIEPSLIRGIHRFEAESQEQGAFSGEVTTQGTLLWVSSPASLEGLPASLRRALLQDSSLQAPRLERVRLMAYEVEIVRPDGWESERFLDALGDLLFEVENAPDSADEDVPETIEDLPAPVASALRHHLGTIPPSRLQREMEFGAAVHAAKWQSSHGEQEVKILDSGLTLFLELPKDEPVPAEVRRQMPPGAEVEALILETYWLSDADGVVVRAVLSSGKAIFPPDRHKSG